MRTVMKCGHVALGKDTSDGSPVCVVCLGLTEDALFAMFPQPDIEGRTAICTVCEDPEPSDVNLPYFQYRHGEELDEYYCGCRWEEEE